MSPKFVWSVTAWGDGDDVRRVFLEGIIDIIGIRIYWTFLYYTYHGT
jgi:hypothetical protein